jgi:glycosyltransferase involved in cell wall biosynthesis
MTGFAKYLQRRGWRVTVLTVARSEHEATDPGVLSLVPDGVGVIRTVSPEPAARILRASRASRPQQAPVGATSGPSQPSRGGLRRVLRRPARWLVDALSYPDYQIGWAPSVARAVLGHVRHHPRTVVLSSTPPHSTQLGVRLARAVQRFRWVADFRDPWTAPLWSPKGAANLRVQRAFERWVLDGCDHVITNTAGNRDALLAAFPSLGAGKVTTVTNAFDTETAVVAADPGDPMIACDIAYFGEIYPRALNPYLNAVRVLVERDPARAPRLHAFGRATDADVARVRQEGLAGHVAFVGRVSYERSLALMRAARSLLLLLPEGDLAKTWIPGKLYPYLFSGRPIVALVPRGDAARVIETTGAGIAIVHDAPARVAEQLLAVVERVRRGELANRATGEQLDGFTMASVAGSVEGILREVAGRD